MPYISKYKRRWFKQSIATIVNILDKNIWEERMGILNYVFTKILLDTLPPETKYHHYNALIGVLESCKLELYRKQIASYEDKKETENGNI